MAARLQALHIEMRRTLFGRLGEAELTSGGSCPGPLSMHRLLQLWDYEGGLSEQVRGGTCRPSAGQAWLCIKLRS